MSCKQGARKWLAALHLYAGFDWKFELVAAVIKVWVGEIILILKVISIEKNQSIEWKLLTRRSFMKSLTKLFIWMTAHSIDRQWKKKKSRCTCTRFSNRQACDLFRFSIEQQQRQNIRCGMCTSIVISRIISARSSDIQAHRAISAESISAFGRRKLRKSTSELHLSSVILAYNNPTLKIFLDASRVIEEKLLDLIHKTKPKRFFSFFFPLCCGHGKLISNFHFNCFVHEKPFLQFLLAASINVSTELLARKNDLNVAQQRNRINYLRIGFVWLELVKVSFSRASARRRHKSIENWIMFPRSGKSKVTGDEVRVTSRFERRNFLGSVMRFSYQETRLSQQNSFLFFDTSEMEPSMVFGCVGESTQYENTMEMHRAQQFLEISMVLR